MNADFIRTKADNYSRVLAKAGVEPQAFDFKAKQPNPKQIAAHCYWMCSKIPRLLVEEKNQQAGEWLRFVDGVLWATGLFSFEEITQGSAIIYAV